MGDFMVLGLLLLLNDHVARYRVLLVGCLNLSKEAVTPLKHEMVKGKSS